MTQRNLNNISDIIDALEDDCTVASDDEDIISGVVTSKIQNTSINDYADDSNILESVFFVKWVV